MNTERELEALRDDRRRRGAARYNTVRYAQGLTGAWEVVGPVALMQLGPVKVTRKNRSTVVRHVHCLGGTFQRNGLDFIRGYLTPLSQKTTPVGSYDA
ncbi:hypothetical protein [Arthrobacter sp. 2MCAF14]|uniref:hypothetical protein n=1 Tax=Arthrobacter sp. 2MCAF14 TaxID=3232982 RepID=UPI003F9012AF